MILPDGTVKEGIFSNNIFYGDNSPHASEKSYTYKSPVDIQKVMHLNYSHQNLAAKHFKNASSRDEFPNIEKSHGTIPEENRMMDQQ